MSFKLLAPDKRTYQLLSAFAHYHTYRFAKWPGQDDRRQERGYTEEKRQRERGEEAKLGIKKMEYMHNFEITHVYYDTTSVFVVTSVHV